jgi:hypothetical protein
MTTSSLPAALCAGADGFHAREAAAGLIIAHGAWLGRADFARLIHAAASISDPATEIAYVDWAAAITALDHGSLPSSGGERRMLQIAASLGDDVPIGLGAAVTGLDDRGIALALRAVLRASGRRQLPLNL